MTEEQKTAAVILAVTDKIENGDAAKPSGYWDVAPMESAHKLDAELKDMSPAELEGKRDRLSGKVT